jgi:hypothetical protein
LLKLPKSTKHIRQTMAFYISLPGVILLRCRVHHKCISTGKILRLF